MWTNFLNYKFKRHFSYKDYSCCEKYVFSLHRLPELNFSKIPSCLQFLQSNNLIQISRMAIGVFIIILISLSHQWFLKRNFHLTENTSRMNPCPAANPAHSTRFNTLSGYTVTTQCIDISGLLLKRQNHLRKH